MAKTKQYWIIGVVVVIAVTAAILFAVPVTVTYQEEETYVDKEPYTVQEPYQVQVEKDLQYNVVNAYQKGGLSGLNWMTWGYVVLENSDTEPGTFIVNCNFRTLKRSFTDSDRVYILPGESKTATCEADTDYGEDVEFTYTVTPGTKTVTETRYREVTKYRDVQKTRTVTKTREVRLYQKLFGLY